MEVNGELPKLAVKTYRRYFSSRTNQGSSSVDYKDLVSRFAILFKDFERCGYFSGALGSHCIDSGWYAGYLARGEDINEKIELITGNKGLWPIGDKYVNYSQNDFFDIVEFLH